MTSRDTTVTTKHGLIAARRTGNGPRNIVCLHPLASAGVFWDPIATALAADATVLAPDARGHGASAWDGSGFTIEDMADDTADLIQRAVGEPVGVVGMSMGGCIAMALAIRHPDLVDRLVLADTTSSYGPDRVEKWAQRSRNARTKRRIDQVDFQLERWFSDSFRAEHRDGAQRIVDIFLATNSEAHAAACTALGAFDCTAELRKITVPTLIVVGELDQATPPSMADTIHRGIAGSTLHVIEGAKHMSLIEDPTAWPRLAAALGTT
jgi:3-oxoadipate enol-lactonase